MNYTTLFHLLFFVSQKCSKKCVHTYTCTRDHLGFWNIRNQWRPHCFPVYIHDCKFNTGKIKRKDIRWFLCYKMNTSDSVKYEVVACDKRETNRINLVISTYAPTSSFILIAITQKIPSSTKMDAFYIWTVAVV